LPGGWNALGAVRDGKVHFRVHDGRLKCDLATVRAVLERVVNEVRQGAHDETAASHAVREYLATLDEAAFGAATPVTPKFISVADPASRWTGANGGLAFFAYCTNYLIDLKHAVIMDVEATTAVRQAEVTAQRRMLDRTQERFGIWPERLAADTGYGDAANLAWLVHQRGIEPHIPVFEKSGGVGGGFGRTDFAYDHKTDSYTCPRGKQLRQFWQEGRAAKAQPPPTAPINIELARPTAMHAI